MANNGVPKSVKRAIASGAPCWFCGKPAETGDHAIPKSRGGPNGIINVIPACYQCNHEKGNMTVEEFRLYRVARHLTALAPARPVCNLLSMLPNWHFYGEEHAYASPVAG